MTELRQGRLAGRVALITGGSSGIGRACALRFAEEGADIVVADRDVPRGTQVRDEIRAATQCRALFVETDIADEQSVESTVEQAIREFGRIDTLVAAAGIADASYVSGARRTEAVAPKSRLLVNLPLYDWQRMLDVNLTGGLLTDRAVARRMIAQGHPGSIVNIASITGRVAYPRVGDYCVSKAGVIMLTQVLALELVAHGIRVNAVGPGFIETPMIESLENDPKRRASLTGLTPMQRLGTPREIADAALYLACDESSYTTGHTIYPNGGMFIG